MQKWIKQVAGAAFRAFSGIKKYYTQRTYRQTHRETNYRDPFNHFTDRTLRGAKHLKIRKKTLHTEKQTHWEQTDRETNYRDPSNYRTDGTPGGEGQ